MHALNATVSLWTPYASSAPHASSPEGAPMMADPFGPICCWNLCTHDLSAKRGRPLAALGDARQPNLARFSEPEPVSQPLGG